MIDAQCACEGRQLLGGAKYRNAVDDRATLRRIAVDEADHREAGAAPTDLDEMARRLYEPLSARLRAELWLDRERAGVMSDA